MDGRTSVAALPCVVLLASCASIAGLGEEPTEETGTTSGSSSSTTASSASTGLPTSSSISTSSASTAGGGEDSTTASSTSAGGGGAGGGGAGAGGGSTSAGGGGTGGEGPVEPPGCGPDDPDCALGDGTNCLVRRFIYTDTCVDYSINSFVRGLVVTDDIFAFGRRQLDPLKEPTCAGGSDLPGIERVRRRGFESTRIELPMPVGVLAADDASRLVTLSFLADHPAYGVALDQLVPTALGNVEQGYGALLFLAGSAFVGARSSTFTGASIDRLTLGAGAPTSCTVADPTGMAESALAMRQVGVNRRIAWGGLNTALVTAPSQCPNGCLFGVDSDQCYTARWTSGVLQTGGGCPQVTDPVDHPLGEYCSVDNIAIAPGGATFLKVGTSLGGEVVGASGGAVETAGSRALAVDADRVFVSDGAEGVLVCGHDLVRDACLPLVDLPDDLGLASEITRFAGGLLVLGAKSTGETVDAILTCIDATRLPTPG